MVSVQKVFIIGFEMPPRTTGAPEKSIVTESQRAEDRKLLELLGKVGQGESEVVFYGRTFIRAQNQNGSLGGWLEDKVRCTGPVIIDYSSAVIGDAIISKVVLRGASLISGGSVSDSLLDSFGSSYQSDVAHSTVIGSSIINSNINECRFSFCTSIEDCEITNYMASERPLRGVIKRGTVFKQMTLDRRR
jgi:hypothetical protein